MCALTRTDVPTWLPILLLALIAGGCAAEVTAPGDDLDAPGTPAGKADAWTVPSASEVDAALLALPGESTFGECEIRFGRSERFEGVDFAIDWRYAGFERGAVAPRASDEYFLHEASVLEPGWLRDGRVVRLDYETRPFRYQVGHGPFARDGYEYRYERVELAYGPTGELEDVVYSVWSWSSHTILPYHLDFRIACASGEQVHG